MLHRNRLRIYLLAFALFGMAVVASHLVHAATFTVVSNDNPGEGFNDHTPVAPVGGVHLEQLVHLHQPLSRL